MRVKEVTVSQTRQIKQYEPERIELVIELEEYDSPEDGIEFGRAKIDQAFARRQSESLTENKTPLGKGKVGK